MSNRLKFALAGSTILAGVFLVDNLNAKTIRRNLRTVTAGVKIFYDYKIRYRPDADIDSIHQSVANRILETCKLNAGLYVKFGQGICSFNHILPPQYYNTLKQLFEDAPSVPFSQVELIFQQEFGRHPDELFDDFERKAVASASIAQVHRARTKDGKDVAVKVQKPYIRAQLDWDMLAYRAVLKIFEWSFQLPMYWTADYTESHLRQEVDFINEGNNAERAAADLLSDPKLAESVYIPKVYWGLTTDRILTCEWIDGTSLAAGQEVLNARGFDLHAVMKVVVSVFAHQIFLTGFCHSDPHGGNILVRKNPQTKKLQVCLLDHGLYVQESENFRLQYSRFWKALFLLDMSTMKEITQKWGINDVNIFASATIQKPYNVKRGGVILKQQFTNEELYEMQMQTKERVKKFLSDTENIPRDLIFIGRNMNLVRSSNKLLGSPVNRINILAQYAVRGLGTAAAFDKNRYKSHLKRIMYPSLNQLLFNTQLLIISVSFQLTRLYKLTVELLTGRRQRGFEEIMELQMTSNMQQRMGIKITEETFSA